MDQWPLDGAPTDAKSTIAYLISPEDVTELEHLLGAETDKTGWFVEGRIDADTGRRYVHIEVHSRGVKAQTDTGVRAQLERLISQLTQACDATWPKAG